jgi:acyl homoserine lactone synthase
MVNDHFARLAPGGRVAEAGVWECTRFCLAADAPARTSAALMLGGAEVGAGLGLREAVGVFDDRMVRIYGRLGWPPRIVGREGAGPAAVALGFWAFSELTRRNLARRAGLSADLSRLWFARALGPLPLAA